MTLKKLFGSFTTMLSGVGHVFGMKEMFDQARDIFDIASTAKSVAAPRGTAEERAFLILLSEVDKGDGGKSNGNYDILVSFFTIAWTPPPHTGAIGKREFSLAKQDGMKFILNMKDEAVSMTPKIWLSNLAEKLKVAGPDKYGQVVNELRMLGVPFPPEIHFDQKVDQLYLRTMHARRNAGWLHKLVRNHL